MVKYKVFAGMLHASYMACVIRENINNGCRKKFKRKGVVIETPHYHTLLVSGKLQAIIDREWLICYDFSEITRRNNFTTQWYVRAFAKKYSSVAHVALTTTRVTDLDLDL